MRVPIGGKYLWAILLAGLIAVPWLLPGYLFGTDWPGPRHFAVPTDFSSGTLFDVMLVGISAVISAEVTTKLLIVLATFAAGLGAFRALPADGFVPRAIAAAIYVVNPFVYGRIHYGQLALVAGYALLPWIAAQLLSLVREPNWRQALTLAAELTALGILDLHLLIPVGVLVVAAAVTFGISRRGERRYLIELGRSLALAIGASFIASLYWLIPLLSGANLEGHAIAKIGTADLAVFSASADPDLGLIPNLLGLYGFWAEDTGRFTSMKAFVPLWPVFLFVLLLLGALGAKAAVQESPSLPSPRGGGRFLRPWAFALLGGCAVALVLEMGVANPVTDPLVRFLDSVFPPYRGMRDAGKWAALIALAYAQLIPLGAIVVLGWVVRGPHPGPPPEGEGIRSRAPREGEGIRSGAPREGEGNRYHAPRKGEEIRIGLATGLLLALPLYYGNGLLFGLHGEVQPSSYPSGWYQADRLLAADLHAGRTLFLPWHLYMGLGFVRNTNNVVASPAPSFFKVPVVISQDPEIPGIAPPTDPDQVAISRLVAESSGGDWARELAGRNIKYVLLARELDWSQFRFLTSERGFALVADYGSIAVYRNIDWQ